jgi:hypothetical protein
MSDSPLFKRFAATGLTFLMGFVLSHFPVPGTLEHASWGISGVLAAETICTPSNVMVFYNRVHVKCVETVGGIQYFAAPTDDAAHVSRVLTILSTALAAGRQLSIVYNPADTSGTAFGCQANDCRTIQAAAFWQ